MGACGAVPAVACVQTITKLWLVPSAKQRRDPCSGHPTDSTNYRKCVSNSPSIWLAITTNKTKPFLTGQSWRVLKSGYTAGSPEQGFRRCFADGVNQSLISSARRLYDDSCIGHKTTPNAQQHRDWRNPVDIVESNASGMTRKFLLKDTSDHLGLPLFSLVLKWFKKKKEKKRIEKTKCLSLLYHLLNDKSTSRYGVIKLSFCRLVIIYFHGFFTRWTSWFQCKFLWILFCIVLPGELFVCVVVAFFF